jgi:hypothetical protein
MSERMIFCLGEGRWEKEGEGYQKNNRVFNVQVTAEEFDKITVPKIKLPVARWIEEKEMTDDEKDDNENYKTLGGYLKTLSYQDAWKLAWGEMAEEVKAQFKNIPHFNADIFKKITGIDVSVKETIEIGGIKYDKNDVENALKDIKSIN